MLCPGSTTNVPVATALAVVGAIRTPHNNNALARSIIVLRTNRIWTPQVAEMAGETGWVEHQFS
jgi:hypothetical protein